MVLSKNKFILKKKIFFYFNIIFSKTFLGNFALAFFIHNSVCSFTCKNEKFEDNTKDVTYGYFYAYIVYVFITIFGTIGCIGRKPLDSSVKIISDLFDDSDPVVFVMNLFFMMQLFTALPIVEFVAKT